MYPTVTIGNQIWLAENLDYKFRGCNIGAIDWSDSSPSARYYDDNETDYGIDGTYKCGLLYNWYAAKYLDDNKTTLLTDGWHVPSKTEVDTLISTVGVNPGTKLKALDNSVVSGFPSRWNGTDDYGMMIIPSGVYRGSFEAFGTECYLWTKTDSSANAAYYYVFSVLPTIDSNDYYKTRGYGIRLVRDLA